MSAFLQMIGCTSTCVSKPAAIPAAGELRWEYLILIQTLTGGVHGTLATWLARSVHLSPRDVWAIRLYLDEHRRLRDRALFDLAIDSKLRGCDIVKMKIGDIAVGGAIRNRATVMQQKTKRPVQFEIMTDARQTLLNWLNRRRGSMEDFIFPSRVNYMGHLSTRQYARLVDEWVKAVGLNVHEDGTHSLRRTKASLIYKATGNLRAIQILLGHSNIENTVRYLGVDVDDAIALAERTEI